MPERDTSAESQVEAPNESAGTGGTGPDAPPLALSHSQIDMFQTCPRRWWLVKRMGVTRAPSEALILGRAVHVAFEDDLGRRIRGDAPATLDELRDALSGGLEQELSEGDPDHLISTARRELLRAHGESVLRGYAAYVADHPFNPVEVERAFEFVHPGDVTLTFAGRVDAVTQPSEGSRLRTIVDWKVVRKPWAPGEEHRRQQATAYLWAERCMEWQPSERVTFVTFPPLNGTGEPVPQRVVDTRQTFRTTRALDAYGKLVSDIGMRIRAMESVGVFPARPSHLCAWCEVRGACASGQEFVRMRGLEEQVPAVPAGVALPTEP